MGKLAALALLFSAQAYACPQLVGSYTCTYQDGSKEVVTIAQNKDRNNVDVYDYNGSSIITDNQAYPIPDDQQLKSGTFRAWCDDNTTLQTQLLGEYYQQGNYYGHLTMNLNLSLQGNDLKQVTTGSLKNTGGEYPLNGESVCVHN